MIWNFVKKSKPQPQIKISYKKKSVHIHKIWLKNQAALVVWWLELMAVNWEAVGSSPVAARCFPFFLFFHCHGHNFTVKIKPMHRQL